jgi:hypothetical protein
VCESGDFETLFFLVRQHWSRCRYRHFAAKFKSVLVAMEPWTGAQHTFAVKAFYKNCDSFVIAQREFEESSGFIVIVLFHQPMSSRPGFETWRLLVLL